MNRIFFGDNLEILKSLKSSSVDLIYIDPPFNTGKTQKLTSIKTIKSENGDRKGFSGNSYQSVTLGTKSYNDSIEGEVHLSSNDLESYNYLMPEVHIFYIEGFLRPRLEEAYRILKPTGSLYFHIDYREVAQNMFKELKKAHPNLSKIIKFVDLKKYELERFESEKRTQEKKRKQ